MRHIDFNAIRNYLARLNPFAVALIVAVATMLLPGENNFFNQSHYNNTLRRMTSERDKLKEEIEQARVQLDELTFHKDKLERYAREEFKMKADDEDLYLLDDE